MNIMNDVAVVSHLVSAVGVFFNPFDEGLVHQLFSFSVQTVIGHVARQIFFRNVEDLVLSGHLGEVLKSESFGHVVKFCALHRLRHCQNPETVSGC